MHISKKFTIMDESALARVEAQRIELEVNITKLRKSLRHWQALDVDYQGLSEEFLARPEKSLESGVSEDRSGLWSRYC